MIDFRHGTGGDEIRIRQVDCGLQISLRHDGDEVESRVTWASAKALMVSLQPGQEGLMVDTERGPPVAITWGGQIRLEAGGIGVEFRPWDIMGIIGQLAMEVRRH